MIIVKIELHSARTGKVTEIGRMHITNNGLGTQDRGDYDIAIMRKGTKDKVQRTGLVRDYPRKSYTVWELVRRSLEAALGKWPIHPGRNLEYDENGDVAKDCLDYTPVPGGRRQPVLETTGDFADKLNEKLREMCGKE